MSQSIGPVAIKLTANSAGVDAGTKDAAKKLRTGLAGMVADAERTGDLIGKSLVARVTRGVQALPGMLRGATSGLIGLGVRGEGLLTKLFGDPGHFLSENILGGLASVARQVPVLGGLLALPFEGSGALLTEIFDRFESEMQNVLKLGRLADQLGMDIGEFNYLQTALDFSGVANSAETAARSITKMQRSLAEAVAGGGAARAIRSLQGQIGATAADLVAMAPDQAFSALVRGVASIENPTLRAARAFEIWGKGAQEIMPLLGRPELLDRTRSIIDRFGSGVSAADYDSVLRVREARATIAQFQAGLNSQILSAVAPILAEAMDRLGELQVSWNGLTNLILDAAEATAKIGAGVVEAFRSPAIRGQLLEMLTDAAAAFGHTVIQYIQQGIGQILTTIGRVDLGWGMSVDLGGVGQRVLAGADRSWADATRRSTSIMRVWESFVESITGTASGNVALDFIRSVRDRAAGAALAARENDPFAAWRISMQSLQTQMEASSPFEKAIRDARQLIDLAKNQPLFDAWTTAMNVSPREQLPWAAGPFGTLPGADMLFPGALARQAFGLFERLKGLVGNRDYQPVGAAFAGSREAITAVAEYQRRMAGEGDIQQQIRDLLREAQRIEEDQLRVGEQVRDALLAGNVAVVGVGP